MKRSPAAAFWLSLIPGAGHVYIGQPSKGLILIVSVASAIYLASEGAGAFFGIVIPFLWAFSMIDAHRNAVAINHRIDTGQPLPPETEVFAVSRWWGWALIIVGIVFTFDNFGWFDIDWIFDLWPVALIALGFYLLKRPTPTPQKSASSTDPAETESETESESGRA